MTFLHRDFKPAIIKTSHSLHRSLALLTSSNQLIHKTWSSNKYNEHTPILRPIDSMKYTRVRREHLAAHHSAADRCLYTCLSFTGRRDLPRTADGSVALSRWESLSARIKPCLFLTKNLNSSQGVHYSQSVTAKRPSRAQVASVKLDKISQQECSVCIYRYSKNSSPNTNDLYIHYMDKSTGTLSLL